MKAFAISVTVILTLACSNQSGSIQQVSNADVADVERLLKQYYTDFSARDWEKFRSHFWPYATITTAWRQPGDSVSTVDVTPIDDFINEAPNGPDSQPIFEEALVRSEIRTRGNLAEAWVDYRAKFGTEDQLSEWTGRDVFTLLRHNEEWKIVSLVFESEK
jgi:hypothetical protein